MTAIKYAILCPVLWAFLFGCKNVNSMKNQTGNVTIDSTETILLGGGCFWCIEAVFLGIKGVVAAEPGYAGGHVENPTYQQVCTGTTGHAEVVKVTFDPQVISLKEILEIFFAAHDPTTFNRQGNDIGPQYRSAIYCTTPEQEKIAREMIETLNRSGIFKNPIVTEVKSGQKFFPAEEYHRNYYFNNTNQPYCSLVIKPKLEKIKKLFSTYLKDEKNH